MSRGFACLVGALGSLCAGCGEDAFKDEDAATSEAPSSDDAAVAVDAGSQVRACDHGRIAALPEGEPIWSGDELTACTTACPELDTPCLRAECPGHEEHLACVADAVDACASAADGPCRAEWTAYVCCGQSQCDDLGHDDDELTACLERACDDRLGAFSECVDALTDEDGEGSCFQRAQDRCLLAPDLAQGNEAARPAPEPAD